ncbi:MAG: hypothetical protein WBX16_18850, partial [Candidatus Acidiferrales bacterium]
MASRQLGDVIWVLFDMIQDEPANIVAAQPRHAFYCKPYDTVLSTISTYIGNIILHYWKPMRLNRQHLPEYFSVERGRRESHTAAKDQGSSSPLCAIYRKWT